MSDTIGVEQLVRRKSESVLRWLNRLNKISMDDLTDDEQMLLRSAKGAACNLANANAMNEFMRFLYPKRRKGKGDNPGRNEAKPGPVDLAAELYRLMNKFHCVPSS